MNIRSVLKQRSSVPGIETISKGLDNWDKTEFLPRQEKGHQMGHRDTGGQD